MLQRLKDIDYSCFDALNGWHTQYADSFMSLMTGKYAYLLFALVLLVMLFRKNWKGALLIIVALALTIALCDQVSSSIIKPLVCRLRPSHDPSLADSVYILNNHRSGFYGFVSSHAANTFGIAVFLTLLFRNKLLTASIFSWSVMVCYTRIYLGVHFPGDIACGATLGVVISFATYRCYALMAQRLNCQMNFAAADGRNMAFAILSSVALLLVASAFYVV